MNNRFVIVAPMFNAVATLPRMLHSVVGQSHEDWKLVLIDDVSDPKQSEICEMLVTWFNALSNNRITLIKNTEKKWEVANVLQGISMCEDNDIVCRLDADDWLTDLDALAIINCFYQQAGCEALWTDHRWGFSDKNISGQMLSGADPYKHPWVSSHFKTFRKYLLNGVKDENFRGPTGEYIRRAGDQAIYLPALRNTEKRLYVPRTMYHYTIKDVPETYQTDDAKFQRDEAIFLRERGYVA